MTVLHNDRPVDVNTAWTKPKLLCMFDPRIAAFHIHPAVDGIGRALCATQLAWLCKQVAAL